MASDNYSFNFIKSRSRFWPVMGPVFREMGIDNNSFTFRIRGKVFFSYVTTDQLEEIKVSEEINSKDSIAHSGEGDIQQYLPGAGNYAISVEDASVSYWNLNDEGDDEAYKYLYVIERYMYECSEGNRVVFCASNYDDNSEDIIDNDSPVSVLFGDKVVNSKNLIEEISAGTNVELEIVYGSDYDAIQSFRLNSITILDNDFVLEETPNIEKYISDIKVNNNIISAALSDNDQKIAELGKRIGIYDRRTTFTFDEESRIVIPEGSLPKTLQGEEDKAVIESFFGSSTNEDENRIYAESREIVISSLRMIDLYKFVLAYMKLPKEIADQTARTCYVAWMDILESVITAVINKTKATCKNKTKATCKNRCGDTGVPHCSICASECTGTSILQEQRHCRYYIKTKNIRDILYKLENPDINRITVRSEERKAEIVEIPVEDENASRDRVGRDLLGINNSVYDELIVSYGVRNTFVHKITSKVSDEEQAEIDRLEANPYKTLDRVEQNCKMLFKRLSKVVAEANNHEKCLREFIEFSDCVATANIDTDVPKTVVDRTWFKRLGVDAMYESAIANLINEVTSSSEYVDYMALFANIDIATQKEIYADKDRLIYLLANSSVWLFKLKIDSDYRNKLIAGIDELISDNNQFEKYLVYLKKRSRSSESIRIHLRRYSKNLQKKASLTEEMQKNVEEFMLYVQQNKSVYDDLLKNSISDNDDSDWTSETAEYNLNDIRKIISNFVYVAVLFSISSELFDATRNTINAFCETNNVPQIIS